MTPEQREELKWKAENASQHGEHIYTNPRDSHLWKENTAWHKAASPEVFLTLIAQVEALNRKNLELQRVYDERGLQIGRLEVALRRAQADAVNLPQAPLTYTVDGVVMSLLEYIEYLHRQVAGERLRADQGWARYESANSDRNGLRAAMVAPAIPAMPGTKEAES